MEEKCKVLEHYMSEDEYEEFITDLYGQFCVVSSCFDAGRILRELDPIAFDCGISDDMRWHCTEIDEVFDDYDDAVDACDRYNEELEEAGEE